MNRKHRVDEKVVEEQVSGPLSENETVSQETHLEKAPDTLTFGEMLPAELPAAQAAEALQQTRQELTQGRVPARKEQRPTYSQWDKEQLLLLVASGVSVSTATAAVGCSRRTFYRWLADDPVFKTRFHSERARAETDPLEMIREHAKQDWRAAQYLHKNAVRRMRRERQARQEPSDKELVQLYMEVVALYNDFVPLVRDLDDQRREAFEKVLAGHADILNAMLQGLWRADEEALVAYDPIWTATA
jgi:hypothetical protein